MKQQFLKDVTEYISRIDVNDPDLMIKSDKFVDEMTEKYSLSEDNEGALCVAVSFIRSIAVLVK